MFTDTDYSTKNNPSVDRAIYLITHYISKKKGILFIYKFVDLIRLARPANQRKGLIPPPPTHTQRLRTECCTNVT